MEEGLPESRTLPAPLTRRASGLGNLLGSRGQPAPQDARVQPRFGALCPAGLGIPGASRPSSPRGPNPRLDPERPERRSPPSPAALTRPRRRPGSRPCPPEKFAVQTPGRQLPGRPAPSRRRPRGGGGGRAPLASAPRGPPPGGARPGSATPRAASLRSPETRWERRVASG